MSKADTHNPHEARLVALICLPAREGSPSDGKLPDIGGRSLALHQLDFALACGARQVVAIGDGASEAASGLRHKAEDAGLQFSIASGPHSLAGIIRGPDGVLVMQAGLFAQSEAALEIMKTADGERVLTLASGAGTNAGFERIDLERAWAGLLLLDGERMDQLLDLPEDSDPFPALLRIALQAHLPEVQISEQALSDGSWAKIGPASDVGSIEADWLARQLPAAKGFSPSNSFARQIVKRCKKWLLPSAKSCVFLWGGAGLIAAASLAAGWAGYFYVSFVGVAVVALMTALIGLVNHIERGQFFAKVPPKWQRMFPHPAVDALLLGCCWLSLGGDGLTDIFPPLMLVLVANIPGARATKGRYSFYNDRVDIAIILSLSTIYGFQEAAMMGLAVLVAVLNVFNSAASADEPENNEPDQG